MRYRFILLVMLSISFGYSQNELKAGDVIRLKTNLEISPKIEEQTIENGVTIKKDNSNTLNYIESGFLYRVKSIKEKTIYLDPLDFEVFSDAEIDKRRKNNDSLYSYNNIIDESERSILYNNKIFAVDKESVEQHSEKVEQLTLPPRISLGVITLPFKYRPQDSGSFDTEFNINASINFRFHSIYKTHFFAQLGTGFGSVNLNSSNSSLTGDNVQDASQLTFFTGLMFQYDRIQAGFYMGFDKINNQNKLNWVSDRNIWIGFGAGYNLFKEKKLETQNK